MASSSGDSHCTDLAGRLIDVLDRTSGGAHPGFRANHARGVLLTGKFTPTREASELCIAPHFSAGTSTRVLARFSSSTGNPHIADTAPDAQPLGLAVRFLLPEDEHTDIIAHSVETFPARTGEELLQFFEAKLAGAAQLQAFAATRPAARAFLEALALPPPASFATTEYFALIAFGFVSPVGATQFVRYSFTPFAGVQSAAPHIGPNFLYEDLSARMAVGGGVSFELWAHLAHPGDATDDITAPWPADRERVLLGTIVLDCVPEHNAYLQQETIFNPLPRVRGSSTVQLDWGARNLDLLAKSRRGRRVFRQMDVPLECCAVVHPFFACAISTVSCLYHPVQHPQSPNGTFTAGRTTWNRLLQMLLGPTRFAYLCLGSLHCAMVLGLFYWTDVCAPWPSRQGNRVLTLHVHVHTPYPGRCTAPPVLPSAYPAPSLVPERSSPRR